MTELQARHGALTINPDQTDWTAEQAAALGWANKAPSRGEALRFLQLCQRTGLDPYAGQLYLIERGGKWAAQTGIDGFRVIRDRIATQRGLAVGYEDTTYCGAEGVWTDVWLQPSPPAAAKVVVTVGSAAGVARFAQVALWREYGSDSSMWRKLPTTMLAKVAEAQALRRAFPHDLSGLYTSDEMAQAQPEAPAPEAPTPHAHNADQRAAMDVDPEVVAGHRQRIVDATTADELRGCWDQLKAAGKDVAEAPVSVPGEWQTDGVDSTVPLYALVKVAKARLDDPPEDDGTPASDPAGPAGDSVAADDVAAAMQTEAWPTTTVPLDVHPDDLPGEGDPVCQQQGCGRVEAAQGFCHLHQPDDEPSDPRAADRVKDDPEPKSAGRGAMAKARADLAARQAERETAGGTQ